MPARKELSVRSIARKTKFSRSKVHSLLQSGLSPQQILNMGQGGLYDESLASYISGRLERLHKHKIPQVEVISEIAHAKMLLLSDEEKAILLASRGVEFGVGISNSADAHKGIAEMLKGL